MVFGMLPRYGAVTGGGQTNNTAMWRAWDELALTNATMFGYWNRSSPVQLLPAGSATSCEKVFATAYVVSGVRIVISIASWSEQPVANCTLKINWHGLGFSDSTANASLAAPQIAGFQNETRFGPGAPIPVRSSEGWLLVAEPDAGTAIVSLKLDDAQVADVSQHAITWTDLLAEPGQTAPVNNRVFPTFHNAMPIGNGHITGMVNYESSKDSLALMVSAASSWVENGEAAKVGLLHVQLPSRGGAPIGAGYRQTFNPQDATVRFSIPRGGPAPAMEVVAYADANSDTIVLSTTPRSAEITATWEVLKPTNHSLPGSSDCQSYQVSADVLTADGRLVYHRNSPLPEDSYMTKTLLHTNVKGPLHGFGPDPMMNRSTGAIVAKLPQNSSTTFAVTVLTANTDTAEEYVAAITAKAEAFVAAAAAPPGVFPPAAHTEWWARKWAKHSIQVGPSSNASHQAALDTLLISQKYVWQRFVELSQARSPFPIKFNSMLYGANRPPNQDENTWGGLNWWQNLRMPYYNMLTSGDGEEMKTLFESFNRTVPIAEQRTRSYFGFEGIWWPEYTHVFYGTPHPGGRGIPLFGYRGMQGCTASFPGEPDWHSDDTWNGYNRQGSLDLSLMILDHFAYSGEVIPDFLAIPFGVVEFYHNLWSNTTAAGSGKMVFYPTQALETWQCPGWPVNATDCPTNDMPTVAGLHAVLEKLLQLPAAAATPAQVQRWSEMKSTLPSLPTINGTHAACDNCILAKDGGHGPGCHRMSNGETAELYSAHPYRQATIARARRGDSREWLKANAAFNKDPLTTRDEGWNQVVMNAALLGNTAMWSALGAAS